MTATTEQQAPGCFASASVYGVDSVVCQACPAYADCGDASVKTLQEIRQLVDVTDLLARHKAARAAARLKNPPQKKPVEPSTVPVSQPTTGEPIERTTAMAKVIYEITPEDQAAIDYIGSKNTKAREQAIVLCKNGKVNDMRAMLPVQRNPFTESGPKYLRVACDMLMRGGFTRASFKTQLMTELGWGEGTAASHFALASALLYSFKIAVPDSTGAFTINPDLYCDNE